MTDGAISVAGILMDRADRRTVLPIASTTTRYTAHVTSETYEWVALTKAAAEEVLDDPPTPATGTVDSWRAREQDRITGAWSLTRETTTTEILTEAIT
jgi:hypothetical protein